jgi:Arc/MetJ-type ribon-helix-helix transcriptional regulator
MRAIVNVSLPVQMNKMINEVIAMGNYSSKSEFFRSLIRNWMEGRFVRELGKSRDELKKGKGKILHSFKDLR